MHWMSCVSHFALCMFSYIHDRAALPLIHFCVCSDWNAREQETDGGSSIGAAGQGEYAQ